MSFTIGVDGNYLISYYIDGLEFTFEANADLPEEKLFNSESRRDIEGVGLINTVSAIYGKNASGKTRFLESFYKKYELLDDIIYYNASLKVDYKVNKDWVDDQLQRVGIQPNRLHYSTGERRYRDLLTLGKLQLDCGGVLLVDTLEESLHPLISLNYVELFKSPKTNPNHARLLFTTHDTLFMHQSVLNGDQIWFIGKDWEGRESLCSVSEYEDYNELGISADYFHGQFGYLPQIDQEVA